MYNSPAAPDSDFPPTFKFLHKTRAQINKITYHNIHPSASHDSESHDEILPEDLHRRAERQEKLDRLTRNESNQSGSSGELTLSASNRETEMGGARKTGPEEVGRMFDSGAGEDAGVVCGFHCVSGTDVELALRVVGGLNRHILF